MALRVGTSLGAVAAALLFPSSVDGAPIETCSDQYNCMQWTVTKEVDHTQCDSLPGGECSEVFKVCVTILPKSVERPNCPDADKGFSHFCNVAECKEDPQRPDYGSAVSGKPLPLTQCQYGSPNSDLYFVFKDGKGCAGSAGEWPLSQCEGVPATLSCFSKTADFHTCTNDQGQVDKECVWHVVTPSECQECHSTSSTSSTPSTTSAATPSTTSAATPSTTLATTPSTTPTASSTTLGPTSPTTTGRQESMPKNMKAASIDPLGGLALAAAGGDKSVAAGGAFASIILVSAGVLVVLSRRARTPAHAPMIQAESVE